MNLMKKYFIILFFAPLFFACKKNVGNTTPHFYSIGDTAFGGVIFYIDSTKIHGLVCSLKSLKDTAQWDETTVKNNVYLPITTGAIGTAIGTGNSNTNKIIAVLGNSRNAAALCRNYLGGGYTDWFLPSRDELYELYKLNVFALTGCSNWSSTEVAHTSTYTTAILVGGCNGISPLEYLKYYQTVVRAVRAF